MAEFEVGAKVDKQTINEAVNEFNKLKKAQAGFVKQQTKAGASSKEIAKGVDEFNKDLRNQTKIIKVLNPEWGKKVKVTKEDTKATKKATRATKEENEALKDQVKTFGELSDARRKAIDVAGAGFGGDVAGQFAGLRSVAATFGGEALGGGFEVGEALADLSEFGPQAVGSLKSVGEGINIVSKTGTGLVGSLAAVATTAGTAIAPLFGGSVALATISAVALPLAVIAGGLAFAFKELSDQAKETAANTRTQFEAQQEVNDLITSGASSTEFLEARVQVQKDLARSQADLATAQEEYNRVIEEGGPLTTLLGAREEELHRIIQEQEKGVRDATLRLGEYNERVFDSGLTANDAALAEENLTAERETAVEAADKTAATIAQFETRRAEMATQAAIAQSNALETEALNQEFADEDQLAQEQKHQDDLLKITSEGKANIEAISSELNKLPAERLQALSIVETEGNEKLNKARTSFFDKSQASLKKFQRETIKTNDKTAKAIRRINEDTLLSTNEAVRANDVSAFLRAQERGALALERATEDATDTEKERVNNFIESQQKEREAFAAKQAEIQAAIQAERKAVNESFTERREQLLDTLKLEREAIEERRTAEIARFNEQEAREEQTAERQRRRQELRDRQQDAAFQRQAQRLNAEQQVAEQAHARALAKIAEIDREIQEIQPPPAATGGGRGGRGSRGASGRGSRSARGSSRFGQRQQNTGTGGRFTPFHDGGRVEFSGGQKEGFIVARADELVIDPESVGSPAPFSNTLNSGNRGASGANMIFAPTIQISSTVGDIASIADVNRANEAMAMELGTQLVPMIERLSVP